MRLFFSRLRSAAGVTLLLSAFLLFKSLSAAESPETVEGFFDQTFGDFSEELQTAKDQGKRGILLMFEMDECPFCHRMKTTVLNRPEVKSYYKEHFLIFPVDIEGDVEIIDFAGDALSQKEFALTTHRVRATPVFAFFDLDGNLVTRYTGATRNADEFMQLGQYVADGAYARVSFPKYKRELQEQAGKPIGGGGR